MNDRELAMLVRLQNERFTYGRIAQIARESGVTSRTLYKLLEGKHRPSATTLDKLTGYFRKEDRRMAK